MTPTPNAPTNPAPAPAPASPSKLSTILKSLFAILAGGGVMVLTGMQQGQSVKQAGIQAGVAALTTVLAYLTKSPLS